jgi:hypothetical protein
MPKAKYTTPILLQVKEKEKIKDVKPVNKK